MLSHPPDRRVGLLASLLLLLCLLPSAQGKNYAFLVACSGYQAGEFRKLPHTVAEMRDFRQALLDTGFAAEEDVYFLHDEHPDRLFLPEGKKILRQLDLLTGRLRPEDTLLVALSGHGLHFKGDRVGYFLPVDAEFRDRATMLPMDGKGGLLEKLQKCKAGRKLLLVNACRNDPLDERDFAARRVQVDDLDAGEVPEGIAALYSCKPGQKSYYYPDEKGVRRSLFYHHLIQAWQGRYAGGGPVTLEHVFAQVHDRTARDAQEIFGKAQTPQPRRKYDNVWLLRPAAGLTREVVAAFRGLGARAGRLWVDPATGWAVFLDGEPAGGEASGLPAFCFDRCDDVTLARLPEVRAPFALALPDTRVTDAGLRRLAGQAQLCGLSLKGVAISDEGLAYLSGLTRLEVLDLWRTPVGDRGLAHLAGLRQLRALNLWGTQVTSDGLARLAGLARLEVLALSQTEVDDDGLAHLAKLPALRALFLGGTHVSGDGPRRLAALTGLETLDLSDTPVGDAGLARLAKLSRLRSLHLGGTRVSNRGMPLLPANHPGLRALVLADTEVDDDGLAPLAGLAQLARLRLGKKVTSAGLKHLAGLTNLEELDLSFSRVGDEGLAHLSRCGRLRLLRLDHTGVGDAGLRHLAGLGQLRRLNLCSTRVSDDGLKDLERLDRLEELDLRETRVTPGGAAALQRKLPRLRVLVDAGTASRSP